MTAADVFGVMDRRLAVSVCASVAALAAGVAGVVANVPVLAVVAGAGGVVAGTAAASIAARLRLAENRLARADDDVTRLRRELDAMTAMFAEEATRRGLGTGADGDVEAAVDESSGLVDGRFFPLLVQHRLAAARRRLHPLSVVLFELDSLDAVPPDVRDQAAGVLGDVVRRTLRECDTACRVGEVTAGAVLEGTTETEAVWAAERVRRTLRRSPVGRLLTLSAGIACYPTHALEADELVELAHAALAAAHAVGPDRVETPPPDRTAPAG